MRVLAALTAVAIVVAVALIIALHSNGSAGPAVAHIGPTATTTSASSAGGATQNRAAAYSSCMRAHGVPSFPDPDAQGHLYLKVTKGGALDPSTPEFQAAAAACKSLAPVQNTSASNNTLQSQGLKYAACMRAHGVPNFPDPQPGSNGGFLITGVDPNSPQFQSAQQACQSLMPGGGPGAGQ
jgi:hypothetical protein